MVSEEPCLSGDNVLIKTSLLADQILQRLSPFLQNRAPIDILDLWPGAGLWSSKVNDLIKPRRHILVESSTVQRYYGKFLKDLEGQKPCYRILTIDPWLDHDWPQLFKEYLPEQGQSNQSNTGKALNKNDTLLVLASPFYLGSKKYHYTSARWWARFMKACAQQSEFHTYGRVRMLAFLPAAEAGIILPRSIKDRKGPALLTEAVTSNAFEVACTHEFGEWVAWKEWDLLVDNTARVVERATERGVVTPPGREAPVIPMAPKSPSPGRKAIPYIPHAMHGRLCEVAEDLKTLNPGSGKKADSALKKKLKQSIDYLNFENQRTYEATEVLKQQVEVDELVKSLSRGAADPKADLDELKALDEKIASMRSTIHNTMRNFPYKISTKAQMLIDSRQAALRSGSFDDAVLLYDRRPFEAMQIDDEEIFPRGLPTSLIYFEADLDSPIVRRLDKLDAPQRTELTSYLDLILPSLVSRTDRTLEELLQLIFPNTQINDIVKTIPSLSKYAGKRLKPDFENFPKTLHPDPEDVAAGKEPDPAMSFQENIDYDFTDFRARALPVNVLLDIIIEYLKLPNKLSALELTRHLGGSVTSAMATGGMSMKKLH